MVMAAEPNEAGGAAARELSLVPRAVALLCCPVCKGPFDALPEAYTCAACRRSFPIVLGIPDLRIYPDPYISQEDDRRKGAVVEAKAAELSFADLVRFYWQITPETPLDLKERFIRHALSDTARARELTTQISFAGDSGALWLDVGCGTAGVSAARGPGVVGCDIAFRWLVVARRRLREAGAPVNLVCCCADALPFRDASFGVVSALSLVEHMPCAQAEAVKECSRVLAAGGKLFATTTNRYSLAGEPHVGLWGVGFLPRAAMAGYVRWRRKLDYGKLRLLGRSELRRLVNGAGLRAVDVGAAPVTSADTVGRSGLARTAAGIHNALRRIPVLGWLASLVAPLLQVTARKE